MTDSHERLLLGLSGMRGAVSVALALAIPQDTPARDDILLLTCGAAGNVVRMIPPLVVTADQIDEGLGLWREAVASV